jgi:phenylalanyl-tRNA synthetase beta chain
MRVSYNWLKEYVDFDLSPKELGERLTMVGLEVASIERRREDSILELEITPNRGDCLSMVGIGRQVAAITNGRIKIPSPNVNEVGERIEDLIKVSIVDKTLCPRYTARIVMGVKVGPSPSWLKDRLTSYGIRPINNIVDITNYVMLEFGNPMHAFDYDLLNGRELLIRRAMEGEKIVTLDGVKRVLNNEMLVIADTSFPVAVAGVIGDERTQVTQKTKNVLVECALFDHISIRRTARALGISTESSYRFERYVDPEGVPIAQARAAELIRRVAGGRIAKGLIDLYPSPKMDLVIRLRRERVNKILGTSLTLKEIEEILKRLGFQTSPISPEETLRVKVPSYYSDITREIDIVEEIARLYGYERIGFTFPLHTALPPRRPYDRVLKKTREILTSLGLYEVITFGFVDENAITKIGLREERRGVRIKNPLSKETSMMRTTLIPGLLKTLCLNMNKGIKDIKIFEIGRIFSSKEEGFPDEGYSLGVAMVGEWWERDWRTRPNRISFYEIAGVLHSLFDGLDLDYVLKEGEHPALLKGRTAVVEADRETLGFVGELCPDVAKRLDLPDGVYIFEIDFDKLTTLAKMERRYSLLPKYPGITRDLSILVRKDLPSAEIVNLIMELGGKIVERVKLFDLYSGERLGEEYKDLKSLGYSILYRDPNTTLTDERVNEIHAHIIDALEKRLGAKLRR